MKVPDEANSREKGEERRSMGDNCQVFFGKEGKGKEWGALLNFLAGAKVGWRKDLFVVGLTHKSAEGLTGGKV